VVVSYHPLVKRDVAEALKYYAEVSDRLADDFQAEVQDINSRAVENPLRFHPTQQGFRRAYLPRFPYHILYEVRDDSLRVMHVRHNKRHPDYGMVRL
jgi:plasmid stabilization system protein ParE